MVGKQGLKEWLSIEMKKMMEKKIVTQNQKP